MSAQCRLRCRFFALLAVFVMTADSTEYGKSTPLLADHFGGDPGFYHGVASGDPLPTSVVLWTRYTPATASEVVELELRIARVDNAPSNDFNDLDDLLDPEKNSEKIRVEYLAVDNATDFALKVDLTGLEPGTRFVYAFLGPDSSGSEIASPVGQTRTAPAADSQVSELRYAVFSCATYTQGYFHSYDIASTIKDIDLFVLVGDFIYEYGAFSKYASNSGEREGLLRPRWETVSLQDYRQRYAMYVEDEAVQNLRRRAPLFAVWDDHELGDNAYGKGTDPSDSGAANHQEVCPVDWTATIEEKNRQHCEFDEGSIVDRFNGAAQAYLEWMPVRSGPGPMGVVDSNLGSLTRVLEWGKLSTFVAFDTRISQRSKEPTLANVFSEFSEVAMRNLNVSEYTEPGPVKEEVDQVAAGVKATMYDPQFTMVGQDVVDLIRDTFEASKQSGKPWQLMVSPTLMGPNVSPNPNTIWEYAPAERKADVKSRLDALLAKPVAGLFLRIVTAMAVTMTPWNRDDWNGFANQKSQLLAIFEEHANNAIVLSGDLHDSWLWQLNEGGNHSGTPVAVNIGGPGVTAPGFGRTFLAALGPLTEDIGSDVVEDGWEAPLGGGTVGSDWSFGMIERGFEAINPGLFHSEVRHEGFVAVKVTAEEHIAEYYHVGEGNMLMNYTAARAANDNGLTAGYFCSGKFSTNASVPGSLAKELLCNAVEFETTERPAEWAISVPMHRTVTSASNGETTSGQPIHFPVFSIGSSVILAIWILFSL